MFTECCGSSTSGHEEGLGRLFQTVGAAVWKAREPNVKLDRVVQWVCQDNQLILMCEIVIVDVARFAVCVQAIDWMLVPHSARHGPLWRTDQSKVTQSMSFCRHTVRRRRRRRTSRQLSSTSEGLLSAVSVSSQEEKEEERPVQEEEEEEEEEVLRRRVGRGGRRTIREP